MENLWYHLAVLEMKVWLRIGQKFPYTHSYSRSEANSELTTCTYTALMDHFSIWCMAWQHNKFIPVMHFGIVHHQIYYGKYIKCSSENEWYMCTLTVLLLTYFLSVQVTLEEVSTRYNYNSMMLYMYSLRTYVYSSLFAGRFFTLEAGLLFCSTGSWLCGSFYCWITDALVTYKKAVAATGIRSTCTDTVSHG